MLSMRLRSSSFCSWLVISHCRSHHSHQLHCPVQLPRLRAPCSSCNSCWATYCHRGCVLHAPRWWLCALLTAPVGRALWLRLRAPCSSGHHHHAHLHCRHSPQRLRRCSSGAAVQVMRSGTFAHSGCSLVQPEHRQEGYIGRHIKVYGGRGA